MLRVDSGLYYIIINECIVETIMHLLMFSPTRGRAGVHGHLTRILSPLERFFILFDIQGAPQSRATFLTANLKTKQRTKQRD